ncbi:MAG: 50S ribosomal protein L9 [Chloroflexi bacterium]|nr:50S ribosomal protein L9 [Chloroflexota bacterium]
MKVLLLKDVYKLGRAGTVRKVATGYGRNYLLPQGLAVLATPAALKRAERIKHVADEERARLNHELSGVAEKLNGLTLAFAARAGETGKLYGSITNASIADAIRARIGEEIDRRHVAGEPLRQLGVHQVPIRLTVDLIPRVTVIIHREGEAPAAVLEAEQPLPAPVPTWAPAIAEALPVPRELAGAIA